MPVVSTLPVRKHLTQTPRFHTHTFSSTSATHRSLTLAVHRSAHFDPVLRPGDLQLRYTLCVPEHGQLRLLVRPLQEPPPQAQHQDGDEQRDHALRHRAGIRKRLSNPPIPIPIPYCPLVSRACCAVPWLLFLVLQKEQLGFDKAVEECKFRMSRYGVTPNMLVLPPQMLLYMALAPEAKLTCAAIYFEYLNLLLVNHTLVAAQQPEKLLSMTGNQQKKRVRSKESRAGSRAREQIARKKERDRKRIEKLTVPRLGACEAVVACLVGKVITQVKRGAQSRRLSREKRQAMLLTDPEALRKKNKKDNDAFREEAELDGLTHTELIAQRKEARKEKPKFNEANYRKQRYAEDDEFRTRCKLSVRLREAMKSTGLSNDYSIVDIVGVPMSVLKTELVATGLSEGLRIATADIDHIFPISRYDMRMEVQKANHWTNLRLCDPVENKKKCNSLPSFDLALMVDRDRWPASVSVSDLL